MHIGSPSTKGFPYTPYMQFDGLFEKDEVGLISVLLSEDFAQGDLVFYAYWAHRDGMRISKFVHREHQGGLTSRGDFGTEQTLWHDTDGFPFTTDTSGYGAVGVLWHYGGKMAWGPDGHIFLR